MKLEEYSDRDLYEEMKRRFDVVAILVGTISDKDDTDGSYNLSTNYEYNGDGNGMLMMAEDFRDRLLTERNEWIKKHKDSCGYDDGFCDECGL